MAQLEPYKVSVKKGTGHHSINSTRVEIIVHRHVGAREQHTVSNACNIIIAPTCAFETLLLSPRSSGSQVSSGPYKLSQQPRVSALQRGLQRRDAFRGAAVDVRAGSQQGLGNIEMSARACDVESCVAVPVKPVRVVFFGEARDDAVDLSAGGGEVETIPAARHTAQCALNATREHSQDTPGRGPASPNTTVCAFLLLRKVVLLLYCAAGTRHRSIGGSPLDLLSLCVELGGGEEEEIFLAPKCRPPLLPEFVSSCVHTDRLGDNLFGWQNQYDTAPLRFFLSALSPLRWSMMTRPRSIYVVRNCVKLSSINIIPLRSRPSSPAAAPPSKRTESATRSAACS